MMKGPLSSEREEVIMPYKTMAQSTLYVRNVNRATRSSRGCGRGRGHATAAGRWTKLLLFRACLAETEHEASRYSSSCCGQPFARAQRKTCWCPPAAAMRHVHKLHGQPFARAHLITCSCPSLAALEHVQSSHAHPFARAHWRTSR